ETSKTFLVTFIADAAIEPDETFFLNLSNPTNATLQDDQVVITIINDDGIGSLNGGVYLDRNGNGIRDSDEVGINGVTVQLFREDLTPEPSLVGTEITAHGGFYSFLNIPVGTYQIVETQPANFNDGLEQLGTLGGVAGNDVFSGIVVRPFDRGRDYNFG